MNGRRQKLKTGDEEDWLYGRRWYFGPRDSGKRIKRGMNRRERHQHKQEVRQLANACERGRHEC